MKLVLLQKPLSKKELNQIFIDIKETNSIEEVFVADWLAYPEYEVGRREVKTDSFRYFLIFHCERNLLKIVNIMWN